MPLDPRHRSRTLVDGPDRAPARAMLKSVGYDSESLTRPLVMVAHSWIGTMPCNFNQRELAAEVMQGIRDAGGTPMEINTVSISDGIAMGTEGMKASLISREVVADSIELCGRGYLFDAAVVIVGCDKTIPGGVMGCHAWAYPDWCSTAARSRPAATRPRRNHPGRIRGRGEHAAGGMTDEQLTALEDVACPGAGACGAQYTANTMATAIEFLGISPMGSGSAGATDPRKNSAGYEAGQLVMDVLARGQLPTDVMTREAFENAIACVASTGGSTNAVLHLLAMAREVGVSLDIDDFDDISERTPIIGDLRPGGRYVALDMDRAGGTRLLAKRLLEGDRVHGDQPTVTGRTLADEAADAQETEGQDVIVSLDEPLKDTGGLVILKGNLAPEGCVIKVAGHEIMQHRGPARVFDREEDAFAAVSERRISPGDVVVIRYRGPEGRAGHARDAGRDGRARGRGAGRLGRAAHGRALQRRDARPDGRARRPGGGGRRPHRGDRRVTSSRSTSTRAGWTWSWTRTSWPGGWRHGPRRRRATSGASSRSTRRASRARRRGAGHELAAGAGDPPAAGGA